MEMTCNVCSVNEEKSSCGVVNISWLLFGVMDVKAAGMTVIPRGD